ncbi:glycine cleavage system protein H [Mycoplasmopsis mucosicanis]|uniref:Glycine cleavage system protein H n=1 Tax=Mycoplasmopsis mucosicanis TaxID=458208 RepID=A0A507SLX3_9BACT|nr:glycine cleavage system protein H [Mycoplasmopsis mucosicanis]TQC51255.1 glycine cleavage system protein H [Mycoplasmopsis mucosicanis]
MKKVIKYLVIEKLDNQEIYLLKMTPEMQDDIGTIGYLEFKNTDKKELKAGDQFAALEASKAVLTLKMPLDATVVEWNKLAIESPKMLSSHKEEQNWIIKLTNIDKSVFEAAEDF